MQLPLQQRHRATEPRGDPEDLSHREPRSGVAIQYRGNGLPRRLRLLAMTKFSAVTAFFAMVAFLLKYSTPSRAAQRRGDPVQGLLDCFVGNASSQ
jgi:hypothetical protein